MFKFLERLTCRHRNTTVVRHIHGDEINTMGGARVVLRCDKCGKRIYR